MSDYSFAQAWNTVAELAGDRIAIACGTRRLTYCEFRDRAHAVASILDDAGLNAGDKVAIELVNTPEYLEVFYGALLLGCVPVNVNYRYVGQELAYLLDNSDAKALIFHDDFAATVRDALQLLAPESQPAVVAMVDHVGTETLVSGAVNYEKLIANANTSFTPSHSPSGDDLMFLYTGGTTGYPKAVMWRCDDLYRALWQMSRPGTEPPQVQDTLRKGRAAATALPACPLMHGTGLFIALSTLSGGGKVVLIDSQRLDAQRTWDEVEREEVAALTIVGDAFARPLIEALDAHPHRWNLATLRAITSSGVTWSPECKRALMAHLPGVVMIDSLGASEGVMTRNESRSGDDIQAASFKLSEKIAVIADDETLITPGDTRVGMVGVGGPIPLGYYKDPDKTAKTFRTVQGTRYSIPGDYATVGQDGTLTLLGRGSACINSGGEKLYPEEIELAIRSHVQVTDCVVVGVPDDRWGEKAVAVVVVAGEISSAILRSYCRSILAGYKVPKHFVMVDTMQRSPSGKADYALLRTVVTQSLEGVL